MQISGYAPLLDTPIYLYNVVPWVISWFISPLSISIRKYLHIYLVEPSNKTAQQTVWSKTHCLGCIGFYVYTVYTCVYLYIYMYTYFPISDVGPISLSPHTIEWYFIFLQLQLHRFRVNLIPEQNEEESAAGGSNPALNGEKWWKMGDFAKRMRFKYAMCSNLVYNMATCAVTWCITLQ